MLVCSKEEKLFSSFVECNIYEVSQSPIQNCFGRECELLYLWDKKPYKLYVMDFFENMEAFCREWMLRNMEKCFGGMIAEGNVIWPSDYIYELGTGDEKTSLGLIFCENQFKNKTELQKILNEKNVVALIKQAMKTIQILHKQGIALNGINVKQLWFDNEDRKNYIQLMHNSLFLDSDAKRIEDNLSDCSKCFFQEKVYSIPEKSCWSKLPLGSYAYYNDLYSAATILFQYLIGRHPLDGRLCDDQENDKGKMEIYNQDPCFIFDEVNGRNRIGEFQGEEVYIEKWNNLSESLRNLYKQLYAFPEMNKEEVIDKVGNMECFQIDKWLECLEC